MSDRDRIRAEAFVEAMLALGVREMTVRPAHLVDLHAYDGLVSMLTELLRRAKAGEIDQMAFVCTEPDSENYSTWISDRGPGGSTLKLVGAVADLQWTALRLHNEQQDRD